jgi:hypothetical protein
VARKWHPWLIKLLHWICTWRVFIKLPQKSWLNSDHRLCGLDCKHTKCFLGMICHVTVMPTVVLLVASVRVTSFPPNITKMFSAMV